MDEDDDRGRDDPAAAFERLRGEVSLLRSAIEGLTAARDSIEIPDYEPTLARTEAVLNVLVQLVTEIGKSPAIKLTPENWGHRVNEAVASATHELRHQVESSRVALATAARDLQGMVVSARRGDQQNWWLLWTGLGGLLLGLILYALLAGPIARLMPTSWQWPERVATRVLAEPTQWDAGRHLMMTDSPDTWAGVVAAVKLAGDNRDAIGTCRKSATRAKKPVRCAIEVKAAE